MLYKLSRLFVIKNKFEACAIIYTMALGSIERGKAYLVQYPGFAGKMLFCATFVAVFMAGAKIFDGVRATRQQKPSPLNTIKIKRQTRRRLFKTA